MEVFGGQVDTGCCGSGEHLSHENLGTTKLINEEHDSCNNTEDQGEETTESPILIRSSIAELQAHVDKRILVGNDFTWAEFIETLCEFDLDGENHCVKGTGNRELDKDSQVGVYISTFRRQMKVYPIKVEMRKKSPYRSPGTPKNSGELQNGENNVDKALPHAKRRRGRSPKKRRKAFGHSVLADKKLKVSNDIEDDVQEPNDIGQNGEEGLNDVQTKRGVSEQQAHVDTVAISDVDNTTETPSATKDRNLTTRNNSPGASLAQNNSSPEVHQETSSTKTKLTDDVNIPSEETISSLQTSTNNTDQEMEADLPCCKSSKTTEDLNLNPSEDIISLQNGDSLVSSIKREESSEDDSSCFSLRNVPSASRALAAMKPSVVQYLSTKVSNKDLLRVREELMRLRDNDDYFKMTALVPMAAGLLEQMLCRQIPRQN